MPHEFAARTLESLSTGAAVVDAERTTVASNSIKPDMYRHDEPRASETGMASDRPGGDAG